MKIIQSVTGTPRVNQKTLILPKVRIDGFNKLYEWLEVQTSKETLTYTLIDPILNPMTFEFEPRRGIQVWCKDENILTMIQLGWG